MRVAYVQTEPRWLEPDANRAALVDAVARAAEADLADLIVAPELCLSGYSLPDRRTAECLAEPADGPTAAALAGVCARRRCHVVAGFAERAGDALYNAAMVVGPSGLVGVYRKVHLFWNEPDWATPGDVGFPVWDLGDYRLGVMICFDWAFPESARTLALRGADVIAHPANLVLPHCRRAMPIRALENRVYTVTANRVGREEGEGGALTFTGRSAVCTPNGERLAEAPWNEPASATVFIDIALARDKNLTPRNDVFADLRPECYRTPGQD